MPVHTEHIFMFSQTLKNPQYFSQIDLFFANAPSPLAYVVFHLCPTKIGAKKNPRSAKGHAHVRVDKSATLIHAATGSIVYNNIHYNLL